MLRLFVTLRLETAANTRIMLYIIFLTLGLIYMLLNQNITKQTFYFDQVVFLGC